MICMHCMQRVWRTDAMWVYTDKDFGHVPLARAKSRQATGNLMKLALKYCAVSVGLVSLCLLSGCAVIPTPEFERDVPDTWQHENARNVDAEWPAQDWWNSFASQELSDIIRHVETRNLDLQNSVRTLQNAQLLLEDAGFDLFPSPILNLGGSLGYIGSEPPDGGYASSSSESLDMSLTVSYTDILSRPVRYEASLASYQSSLAQAADLRLNIHGTAASTYFRILFLRDRIEAATLNLQNAQEIARIVEARVDAGVVPAIDALQQQIAVQQQVSTIAALKQEEFAALSALAVLMVKPVNAFEVGAKTLQHLATPQVVPGIPSELLHRRPDLVRAEAALRIARADLEAARRALLPSISLTAAVNRSSESLVELVSGGGLGISITSGLVQRIFDTGHRNRRLRHQQLTYESLIADYRQAIIRAFSDVEVALGNISLLESLGETALEDLARATESLRIAEVRYREGVDDYQSVLYAQNLLYSTRDSVLGNKLAHLNAIIRVYQSIGGGWRSDYPAN